MFCEKFCWRFFSKSGFSLAGNIIKVRATRAIEYTHLILLSPKTPLKLHGAERITSATAGNKHSRENRKGYHSNKILEAGKS